MAEHASGRQLRITVDHELCVGNGQCVNVAPGVFRHNDYVQSEVVNPAGATEQAVLRAAHLCPTSAIRVEDAVTGDVLFP
ncbi:MAG: ferredoxin [Gemmatimonadaceae bacterium]